MNLVVFDLLLAASLCYSPANTFSFFRQPLHVSAPAQTLEGSVAWWSVHRKRRAEAWTRPSSFPPLLSTRDHHVPSDSSAKTQKGKSQPLRRRQHRIQPRVDHAVGSADGSAPKRHAGESKRSYVKRLFRAAEYDLRQGRIQRGIEQLHSCLRVDRLDSYSWLALARAEARRGHQVTNKKAEKDTRKLATPEVPQEHYNDYYH